MFRRIRKVGRLFVCAKSSVQPSCTHSLSTYCAQDNMLQGVAQAQRSKKWSLSAGSCMPVLGGQEEVPRIEAGGRHRRKGLPRSGEFRDNPQGGTQV